MPRADWEHRSLASNRLQDAARQGTQAVLGILIASTCLTERSFGLLSPRLGLCPLQEAALAVLQLEQQQADC